MAEGLNAQSKVPNLSTARCYELKLVPGDVNPERWGRVHHPPDTAVVDSEAFRTNLPSWRYRGLDRRLPYRAFQRGDTLELVWFDGLTGVRLIGIPRDSVYSGIARILTDVVVIGEPLRDARFEGRIVACPDSIPTRPDQ